MNAEPALREIADGSFAYLQVGGWGYSNAGLITSDEASLLVDTLYDLALTGRMLDAMRRASPAAREIDSVVNTHANGDHCWGNQLVGEARIISSRAAAEEMLELSPGLMHTLVRASRTIAKLGPVASAPLRLVGSLGVRRARALAEAAGFVSEAFGPFNFGPISLRPPDTTFEGRMTLHVGGKEVHLIEVGPAHTRGDVIVHVPKDRIVYTGDILFMGSHPIVWEGPIENWVRACDTILGLDVDVVVPGHGPLTDKRGVQSTRDYWVELEERARKALASGASREEVARDLRSAHAWRESERVIANVDRALAELTGQSGHADPLEVMASMARFSAPPRC